MDSPGPAKQGSASDASHEPHNTETDSQKPPTSATTSNKDVGEKFEVLLKPVGDAPTLKNRKWTIPGDWSVRKVSDTVRNMLKLEAHESLFLYVAQAFAPAPDTEIGTLFQCFASDGRLVLHYCKTQAWG